MSAHTRYPAGIYDSHEPSGMAPPAAHALAGYHLTYVNDFKQPHIPLGWFPFSGLAGGLPTDRFSVNHIQLARGLLQLKTYRDPANSNRWTTAGLCQCGRPFTYGAVFVRSRETSDRVNSVELLWPYDNQWPPEIDFNESMYKSNLTTSTVHWLGNKTDFHVLKIDMLKWHTWGVIWTATHILFTVDGRLWHEFSAPTSIPHLPMRVDFEQRVNCPSKAECPTKPSALQIDWVAEYLPN
ncbi:MAG: glycoside hydrolase family 16 protein [Acidobacteria bacterium]|nr:glycoside hydrolase family 16 protein [Acidobacteriota bacterium]